MLWLFITLAVSVLAGLILYKLRVPGGLLVGAVVAACILNLTTGKAFMYPEARVLAQIITGAYIGGMVTRREVKQLPSVIKPFIVVLIGLLVLNLAVGLLIFLMTDLDLLTSLFCSMPGGMTDTPLIALDMGANSAVVTAMQFIRMLFGLSCLPTLLLLVNRRKKTAPPAADGAPVGAVAAEEHTKTEEQPKTEEQSKTEEQPKAEEHPKKELPAIVRYLPTLLLGACGGVLGKLSGLPAGTMTFTLIVVAALNLFNKAKPMPKWLRRVAQVFSGCCIGVGVMPEQLVQLKQMLIPALVLCLAYFINCVLVGILLHKRFRFNLLESMMLSSPAGATEMALIAADMGIESTRLAVMQIARLVTVTIVFPQLFRLVLIVMQIL